MRRRMSKYIAFVMTLVLAFLVTGCSKDSAKETADNNTRENATIKVGSIRALGTVTPYISEKQKYFEDAGLSVEIVDFADGSALGEAFAAGGLDIALMGIAPTATWQSKGVELKVVASANGGGHVILTRNDSNINSIADLKGHIVAGPNPGTVTDTLLRDYILPGAGLDPENDVQILSGMKPADMAVALAVTKEVDAVITWEPFATQAEDEYDNVKVLYDSAAELKKDKGTDDIYPVNVMLASQAFIDGHTEELQKFIDVYKKTVDFINNDPTANAVLAAELELDESVIAKARERISYTYDIDAQGLFDTLKWAKDLGYLDSIPTEEELFDYSFLK